jgi:FO synthase
LRGTPYLLTLDDIANRAREAWDLGATEVTLQGGIHPDFDGDYYIDVTRAVKDAVPDMHVHGFTALEVTEGAKRLGEPLYNYIMRLKDAGLASLPGTAAEILDDDIRAIWSTRSVGQSTSCALAHCKHRLAASPNLLDYLSCTWHHLFICSTSLVADQHSEKRC